MAAAARKAGTPLVHLQRSERSERSPPRAHSPSSHQPRPSPLIYWCHSAVHMHGRKAEKKPSAFEKRVQIQKVHRSKQLFSECCESVRELIVAVESDSLRLVAESNTDVEEFGGLDVPTRIQRTVYPKSDPAPDAGPTKQSVHPSGSQPAIYSYDAARYAQSLRRKSPNVVAAVPYNRVALTQSYSFDFDDDGPPFEEPPRRNQQRTLRTDNLVGAHWPAPASCWPQTDRPAVRSPLNRVPNEWLNRRSPDIATSLLSDGAVGAVAQQPSPNNDRPLYHTPRIDAVRDRMRSLHRVGSAATDAAASQTEHMRPEQLTQPRNDHVTRVGKRQACSGEAGHAERDEETEPTMNASELQVERACFRLQVERVCFRLQVERACALGCR